MLNMQLAFSCTLSLHMTREVHVYSFVLELTNTFET